jgi:leader peptidase (prepilin peptidase)/N-methyltransferase
MELAIALLLGLAIGSFLNVCIARVPVRESIVSPRSRCPGCRKPIASYDNIPVLSYLLLRGRCRSCGKTISIRYPAVEALTAVVSVLMFLKYGLSPAWLLHFSFSAALIVLAFIDEDHRILPDSITLNGIWLGLLAAVVLAEPLRFLGPLVRFFGLSEINPRLLSLGGGIFGAIVGGGLLWGIAEIYLRLRGVEGMGFGDVKMMAMVGAFLGAPLALFTIMTGSLVGSIVGITMMKFGGKSRDYELPFGQYLAFAAIAGQLIGNDLIQLYVDRMIRPGL